MLFFRSEERANEWCRANGVPRRPIVSLDQLWRLAVAWYDNRLDPDARRARPDEIRRIFAGIGLGGAVLGPAVRPVRLDSPVSAVRPNV